MYHPSPSAEKTNNHRTAPPPFQHPAVVLYPPLSSLLSCLLPPSSLEAKASFREANGALSAPPPSFCILYLCLF